MGMILIVQLGLRSGFVLPHRASSVTEWGFSRLFDPQYSDRVRKYTVKKTTVVKVSLSLGILDRSPHAKPSPPLRRTPWLAADA
jgi:hypothetical protein